MNFNTLRYALRQPASIFEVYKGFNTTHPKQMNTWLLFSSMGIAFLIGRGAEKLVCIDVDKVGAYAYKPQLSASSSIKQTLE